MTTLQNSWNAPEWRDAWMKAAATGDRAALQTLRKNVFDHTVTCVQNGGYIAADGQEVTLPPLRDLADNSRFYKDEFRTKPLRRAVETAVRVVAEDCLVTARRITEHGEEVCVLNMANRRTPGGGVLQGCGAQEEYLFRCSNYYTALYRYGWQAQEFGLEPAAEQYPLDRHFGGVFTRGVTVFRGAESEGYPLLAKPWLCNMIAVAALNRPETVPTENGERLVPELVPAAKNKIRTVLRVAADNGQANLVLGAMGCGAFRNPPAHVAELFAEVLAETEFYGVFKRVFFSITEDCNPCGNGNWEPFARMFNPTAEAADAAKLAPQEVLVSGMVGAGSAEKHLNRQNLQQYILPLVPGDSAAMAQHVETWVRHVNRHPERIFLLSPLRYEGSGEEAEVTARILSRAARFRNVRFPLEYQRYFGADAYMGLITPPLPGVHEAEEVRMIADAAATLLRKQGMPDSVWYFIYKLMNALTPSLEEGRVSTTWAYRVTVLLEEVPPEQWSDMLDSLRRDPHSVALPYAAHNSDDICNFLEHLKERRTLRTLHLSAPFATPTEGEPSTLTPADVARLLHSSAGYCSFYEGYEDFHGFLVPLRNHSLPVFHMASYSEVKYANRNVRAKHLAYLWEREDFYWREVSFF